MVGASLPLTTVRIQGLLENWFPVPREAHSRRGCPAVLYIVRIKGQVGQSTGNWKEQSPGTIYGYVL